MYLLTSSVVIQGLGSSKTILNPGAFQMVIYKRERCKVTESIKKRETRITRILALTKL